MIAAAVVFVGTTTLHFGIRSFAVVNLVLVGLWLLLLRRIVTLNEAQTKKAAAA